MKKRLEKEFGYFYLSLFIVLLVNCIIGFCINNIEFGLFCFGSIFLCTGLITLFQKMYIGSIFAIIGLCMVSFSLSEWFGSGLVSDFFEKNMPFLMGLVFFIVCLVIFIFGLKTNEKEVKRFLILFGLLFLLVGLGAMALGFLI